MSERDQQLNEKDQKINARDSELEFLKKLKDDLDKDLAFEKKLKEEKVSEIVKMQKEFSKLELSSGERQQVVLDKDNQIILLNQQKGELKDRLDEQKKIVGKKDTELADLKEQLNDFDRLLKRVHDSLSEMRQDNAEKEKLILSFRQQLQEKEQEFVSKVRAERDSAGKKLVKTEDMIKVLRDQNAEQFKEYMGQLQVKDDDLKQINELITRKELILNDLNKKLDKQELDNENIQKELHLLKDDKKELLVTIDELKTEKTDKSLKLKEKESTLVASIDAQAVLKNDYAGLLEQHEQLRKDNEMHLSKVKYYEEKLESKEKKLQALREDIQKQVSILNDQLSAVSYVPGDMQQQKMLKEKKVELEEVRILAKQKERNLKQEIEKLRQENKAMFKQSNELAKEKLSILARMVQIEERQSIDNADIIGEDISREITYMKKELAVFNNSLEDRMEEINNLQDENYRLYREKEELQSVAEGYKEHLLVNNKKLQHSQEMMAQKEKNHFKKIASSQKELDVQLRDFRKVSAELEQKNGKYDNDIKKYVTRVNNLRNKLMTLQSKHNELGKDRSMLAKRLKEFYSDERSWEKKDGQSRDLLKKYDSTIDELTGNLQHVEVENERLSMMLKSMPKKLHLLEKKVGELRLQNGVLHYNLGVFHTQRQEFTQAVKEFKQALKFNSNDSQTHFNLGVIYSQYLVDEPKAVMYFKHYLAINPQDKDASRAKEYLLLWDRK